MTPQVTCRVHLAEPSSFLLLLFILCVCGGRERHTVNTERERELNCQQRELVGVKGHILRFVEALNHLTCSRPRRQAVDVLRLPRRCFYPSTPPSWCEPTDTSSSADIHLLLNMFCLITHDPITVEVLMKQIPSIRPVTGHIVITAFIIHYWAQSNYWSGSLFL